MARKGSAPIYAKEFHLISPEEEIVAAKRLVAELLDGGDEGMKRDYLRTARPVLIESALCGDIEAQNFLGAVALEIEENFTDAREWFTRSALSGDPVGQRSLGYLYATGQGVAVNIGKAVELYRTAVDSGDQYAMYNLASLDPDVSSCSSEARLLLLERAAEFGIPEAAADLGDELARADRDDEAISWYHRAAAGGHTGAMNALGSWFRDGVVGPPDYVEALRWFLEMLNHGNGDGMHEAIQLVQLMTEAQVRAGALLAGQQGIGEALLMDL